MIDVKNVKKSFITGNSKTIILNDVTFSIERGRYVAITGPSGSGKSTLLNVIGGLEPIDGGEIYINRDPVHRMNDDEMAEMRASIIGYVFQQFHLLPTATALENVMMPLLSTTSSKEVVELAKESLKRVGLEHRMNHLPSKLSGGEQQRVAIARAMVIKPRILLADEPTGNLDSETGKRIIDLIEGLREEQKMTIVLVTHDLDLAARADSIIHVRDGEVGYIEQNSAEKVTQA